MALCRYETTDSRVGSSRHWGWIREGRIAPLDDDVVSLCFRDPGPTGLHALESTSRNEEPLSAADLVTASKGQGYPALVAPLTAGMEVWAAGVTYESSKFARMAESPEGGDFYAKVYMADRPELFFKGALRHTVGPNDSVRIRRDSNWNVPEPELALLIAATGKILGFTVGNDMSSRDIEGENPLYLPQAKVYKGSCALGPIIVPADRIDPQNLGIALAITRTGETVYRGETSTARMKRNVADLADWLFRENEFPEGVVLLTGTGLIPPDDFTLESGDEIAISIESIGTLRNRVA